MSLQDAEKLQMNELDWIQIRNDISDTPVETFKEKIIRKTSENPLVPLGKYNLYTVLLISSNTLRTIV